MIISADNTAVGGSYSEYDIIESYAISGIYDYNHTISNKKGSKLLILLADWSGSSFNYQTYDNATCSGGTITKLSNVTMGNTYIAGTFFQLDITSDTCVITTSSRKSCMFAFEAK